MAAALTLHTLILDHCTGLTTVDALADAPALTRWLPHQPCTRLTCTSARESQMSTR
jgi:hypothetical protein